MTAPTAPAPAPAPATATTEQVHTALQDVYDPCSQSWQRPMSLVDLGLIRAVSLAPDGRATVRISLTAPFCMAVPTIMQSIEQKVGAVDGVSDVTVELDGGTLWRPELMTDKGRELLADARADDRRMLPLTPVPGPGPS
ncbi:metal-sulfur cluster assembly factor [Streptomyces longispororuber]|uniref:metal-sulfur cluster assembly factor n=1 Tax=Streptomyces longispororuber TaxID=68230 RepID=UPI002109E342|nr:iron-sulfur cluster assembly protein [Streptomyces longispororuber]MCQ4209144.1 iron-sulfur cluster assembly protein [Streptomyces longispororuber]